MSKIDSFVSLFVGRILEDTTETKFSRQLLFFTVALNSYCMSIIFSWVSLNLSEEIVATCEANYKGTISAVLLTFG